MDTTSSNSGKESSQSSLLDLEQALQTYPEWNIHCPEPPVVLETLGAGLTNKCYLVQAGDQRAVLRLNARNGRAISLDRVNEQVALRNAYAAGFGPETVYCCPQKGVLVTGFIEGRHWTVEEAQSEQNIERLVQLLRRVHSLPGIGKHQIPADIANRYLRDMKSNFVLTPDRFQSLRVCLEKIMVEATENNSQRCLCHNDMVLGNIIDNGGQLSLIDWEFSAMGDPMFDLAVLVHNLKFGEPQMQQLLESYFGRVDGALQRQFLCNYAIYVYIDMLWHWLQSAYHLEQEFGEIAEGKIDTLVAILHELGC